MTILEEFGEKLCYLWNLRNSIIQDPDKLQLIESDGKHYYDAKEVDRIDFNFYTAMLVFLEEQKKLTPSEQRLKNELLKIIDSEDVNLVDLVNLAKSDSTPNNRNIQPSTKGLQGLQGLHFKGNCSLCGSSVDVQIYAGSEKPLCSKCYYMEEKV